MTAADRDFATLDTPELIEALVQNIRTRHAVEHIGRKNRLMMRERRILDALKARTDGTLRVLLPLLDHRDLRVRLSMAIDCKPVDRAASLAVIKALAERRDEIGRDARQSLEWEEFLLKHPPTPAPPRQHKERFFWQSRRAPPDGVTRLQLEQRLCNDFSEDGAAPLLALMRPAIRLWPQRPVPEAPIAASHLGGMPCVPANWSWPIYETEPLFFLGQINCADLVGLPSAEALPREGLLAFFADHDAVMGCGLSDERQWAVHYWPVIDALRPAATPIEDFTIQPSCTLDFVETVDLPDPGSAVIEALGLADHSRSWYGDVRDAIITHGIPEQHYNDINISKVLGWPNLVQNELDVAPERPGSGGWRLLLQIGSYENGTQSHGWGPGGLLYFMIRDEDLARRRFDRAQFDMQCT